MKEYCSTFMEDYSKQRNKPSTQRGYRTAGRTVLVPADSDPFGQAGFPFGNAWR